MKKSILFILTVAAILASCSNEELASGASISEGTSVTIAAYVADNYPATKVVSTTRNGATVTAILNTGEELSFTTSGSLIAYANNYSEGLEVDSLGMENDSTENGSITTDSIGMHRHGGHEGRPGEHGGYAGQGSDVADSIHAGVKHGHGHVLHFKNEISIDSLSAEVNTYIGANYSGYTVIHAEIDTICQGIVTEVLVCNSTAEPVKLIFDAAGVYLMKAERMHYTDVPAEVTAVVTANYATYDAKKRAEKFTTADGSFQYKIFMSLNKAHKWVTFNADGTVACEK